MGEDSVLKQHLRQYKHPDFTSAEIIETMQKYKGLAYRSEAFVFNSGKKKDLINLAGTIPVNYKGVVYNIPVCIWLMDTHPMHAPLCFVKPTADMSIKVSKHVDSNGRVYLPYLHEWQQNKSNLLTLIQCMISAFSELPPVYAKPRTETRPPYPQNSFMPQPSGYPYPQVTPQPGYPPAGGAPYPTSSSLPYPNYGAPYPGPLPVNGTPYPMPSEGTPYPPSNYTAGGNATSGTITEEHIKASLLSAVKDKLRRKLNDQYSMSQAEIEILGRTQQELKDGKARLEDMKSKLEKEVTELDKNLSVVEEKEKELKSAIESLSEQEGIDVDEAVVTTAPLYNQLMNAFGEEGTLEDVMYFMGEALRKEVIDLDTFLKQVRSIARRQFTLRAIMQKCRQKAQLAC